MAFYSLAIDVHLGAGQTGLTITAQPVDTGNNPIGGLLSEVIEIGNGDYFFYYAEFSSPFAGGIVFYNGSTVVAFTAVNISEFTKVILWIAVAAPGAVGSWTAIAASGGSWTPQSDDLLGTAFPYDFPIVWAADGNVGGWQEVSEAA